MNLDRVYSDACDLRSKSLSCIQNLNLDLEIRVFFGQVLSAMASIVSTVFFGYSRDKTASYKQDLSSLLVLGFVCLALTLFLTFWDARRGWSVLNRPGNMSGSEAMRGH